MEPKKQFYSWEIYHQLVLTLRDKISLPDVIVSIGKGGTIPGVILAEKLGITNLNFGIKSYSNFTRQEVLVYQTVNFEAYRDSKILIVDDLTDSGKTFEYVTNAFLKNYCEHIKTASVFVKEQSSYIPDFFVEKVPSDVWIVQPWEV